MLKNVLVLIPLLPFKKCLKLGNMNTRLVSFEQLTAASAADTLCHGIETSAQQNCPHRRWGYNLGREQAILSEPLYCVTTMLDASYKDRYFDADKQGLREMLQRWANCALPYGTPNHVWM